VDLDKERTPVKASIVFEVEGRTLVLAQTDPPILQPTLLKEIAVTYLATEDGMTLRHGFPARIVEFVDCALSSGQPVKALKVERTGEPRRYNIRMFCRAAPRSRSGASINIDGTATDLLDLSLGGAKISYAKSLKLERDAMVKVSLEMSGKTHSFTGRILRTWDGASDGLNSNLTFAAIEFEAIARTIEQALSRKIREIGREAAGPSSL
jgi:hypothetical protein